MTWLHTLQRGWFEFGANLRFRHLALTILDPDRSRIVSIDFVDNPYHGQPDEDDGELCSSSPTDGTTACHRYCTAYVVSNGKPVSRRRGLPTVEVESAFDPRQSSPGRLGSEASAES